MLNAAIMVTLFNVISADGFIAREDGSEDFIPDSLWSHFLSACGEYGTVIMGRRTYDTIRSYSHELTDTFDALPVAKIVVTSNKDFKVKDGYTVVSTPEEAISLAPHALVSSGPTTNNYFIQKGFVQKIILLEVSTKIGSGIRPYDPAMNLANIEIQRIKV